MDKKDRYGNFIVQGSILAIAGIVCRLIGMLYRVPLVEIIGTVGNGYYTSAYNIYNILLILSSYSLPTAISKLISVRLAGGRIRDVQRVLRVAFIYCTLAGGIACALMYFGAGTIAALMGKPFCEYALKTLAPTIWIMAYLGLLRGYFQGTGDMTPTALSQIIEQIVNALVSVLMAYFLFDYGVKANYIYNETEFSYAYGAAGGTIGTGAGALVALLFFILLLFLYGVEKRAPKAESVRQRGRARRRLKRPESYGHIAKVLVVTLLPILISSCVYNISSVIDDLIFSNIMTSLGLGASVVLLWGIYGEYRILFNVPVAIANSLSSSLIPSLTNAVASRDRKLIINKIRMTIRFSMLIAIPATVGLIVLAEPICDLLFHTEDNTTLIRVVMIGAVAVVFFSLSTVTNGILQGLGYLSEPLKNSAVSLVFHILILAFLLCVPKLGIYSVLLANIGFAMMVCAMNSRCIHRHVRYKQDLKKTYIIPTAASIGMGAAVYWAYRGLGFIIPEALAVSRIGLGLSVVICIFVALLVYFVLLFILKAFNKSELLQMPMGGGIYRFARRIGFMR